MEEVRYFFKQNGISDYTIMNPLDPELDEISESFDRVFATIMEMKKPPQQSNRNPHCLGLAGAREYAMPTRSLSYAD